MSRRDSGYERQERELYETPEWVTRALLPHLPAISIAWDPACASGKILTVLGDAGIYVHGSDIHTGRDFTKAGLVPYVDCIITNPPFSLAQAFIERALAIMWPAGVVAMLLSVDFDSAKTRKHLFDEHPAFCKTVVLTKRIKWFEGPVTCKRCNGAGFNFAISSRCKACNGRGHKNQGPSENHAWFVWDWKHTGRSTKVYAP